MAKARLEVAFGAVIRLTFPAAAMSGHDLSQGLGSMRTGEGGSAELDRVVNPDSVGPGGMNAHAGALGYNLGHSNCGTDGRTSIELDSGE